MQTELDILRQQLAEKDAVIARLQAQYNYLAEQFRLAQQKRFGTSSEAHTGQGELFNEAEAIVEQPADEDEKQHISYTRKKPGRKPLPDNLPREQVVIDLAEEDKVCDGCHGALHKIGEDTSEKLEFIPAQVKVIETIRPKYSCRACDKHGERVQVKQAPVPPAIIPKGIATPSLLAQIITSKYQYGLPLYRQEAMFKQYGIDLSRQTMADWMLRCADVLQILYDLLKQLLLQQAVIMADETTLKVVNEAKSTCYMWLYCTGAEPCAAASEISNIVLYDYQASRAGQCAVDFLDGYSGYLQCDGYVGYEQTLATLVGCWAHARRKFIEAKQAQPKGKSGKADVALNHIQKLYVIESQIKAQTPHGKQAIRQVKAVGELNKLKAWLDKSQSQVPPKSTLGSAITYCLNQWHKLIRYTEDGNLNIDNNRAERAIKPFVIGRKNWLFSNTAKGAKASAILYSIIETAKANSLMPFDYLNKILTELPRRKPTDGLTDLLPLATLPDTDQND